MKTVTTTTKVDLTPEDIQNLRHLLKVPDHTPFHIRGCGINSVRIPDPSGVPISVVYETTNVEK